MFADKHVGDPDQVVVDSPVVEEATEGTGCSHFMSYSL